MTIPRSGRIRRPCWAVPLHRHGEGGEVFVERRFKYVGPSVLTRGQHGVFVEGAHNTEGDAGGLYVHDPDVGDMEWGSVEAALASGDWVELNPWEELRALADKIWLFRMKKIGFAELWRAAGYLS